MTSMFLRTAAVATFVLCAAASAQAQETLQVTAHDDGGDFYFMVEGLEGQNPAITLEPGTDVTIEFSNEGPSQPHNLHFGDPIDEQTEIIDPGASSTLEFTVPADASGSAQYWCDPHRFQGMEGDVAFAGGPDGSDGNGADGNGANGEEDGNGAPGPALFLVLIGLAVAAARRR